MPDSEQQHINLGYNGASGPTRLSNVTKWDVVKMLREVLLFQTKSEMPLEDIIGRHRPLIDIILKEFKEYEARMPV